MPKLLYTVDNLVNEVRAQLDESNVDSVSTTEDILPALNRAQDYAFDILARKYPEPILAYQQITFVANQAEYDIPENVFEDRVLKLETILPSGSGNSNYKEIQRISYSDLGDYESSGNTRFPYYYAIFGRTIRLNIAPTGQYNARMWYLRQIEKLVQPQGRITVVNSSSNYVILDSAGSGLTTESDQLGSYVNVIDGQTGEIKASLQIQTLNDNKVTFRTVPLRSQVLNKTISSGLSGIEIEQDDYLCAIDGICVPYYGQPTSNFLIQYAVSEVTRKLGGSADMEERVLDKFEKQVERTWVRRENTMRVKKRSRIWGVPVNRFWYWNN